MKNKINYLLVAVLLLTFSDDVFSQNVNVSPNNASYLTLGAAFNAINSGVHGINIAVSVTIINNTTESASATLNGGVFSSCTIRPSATVTVTGNLAAPVIILNGADSVEIDGRIGGIGSVRSLTINNPNVSTLSGCINLQNGATLNTIKYINCLGIGVANTQGGRAIYVGQSTSGTGGNNNNTIDHCLINGARRGIQTFGTASLHTNDNTFITNNIVKNCSSLGILIGSEVRNATCDGNDIFNDLAVAGDYKPIAIQSQGVGSIGITKNKIHDWAFTSFTGTGTPYTGSIIILPVLLTAPGSNVTTVNINNNFVSNIADNAPVLSIYGINLWYSNAAYTANVYYNSVRIGGNAGITAGTESFAFLADLAITGSTLKMYNNIGFNERVGGDANSFHNANVISPGIGVVVNADYNIGIATDPIHGWDFGYNGYWYRDLDLYHDSTYPIEQNTVAQVVSFVSPSDLHLAPGTIGGNFAGIRTFDSPTTDIDGDVRSLTFPYRGADERSAFKLLTLTCKLEGRNTSGTLPADIDVQLNNSVSPYNSIAQGFTHLTNSNVVVVPFGDAVGSGPYWIVCFTRSHIETWSSSIINFAGNPSYNFLVTGAYGGNTTASNEFYGGDINQDGTVDGTDGTMIENDSYNFHPGNRIITDINHDGFVDATDLTIQDNNAYSFVSVSRPPTLENKTHSRTTEDLPITKRTPMRSIVLQDEN